MRTPRQLAETIDTCIVRGQHGYRPLDAGRVTRDILSSLPLEDRQGIDPELLQVIVTARSANARAWTRAPARLALASDRRSALCKAFASCQAGSG